MLKTIAFPLIALMLIFSILAPSVLPLVDKECKIVLVDTNEEEKNQEKESEKKFGEKDLFIDHIVSSSTISLQYKRPEQTGYLFLHSDHKVEILLPPPEQLI